MSEIQEIIADIRHTADVLSDHNPAFAQRIEGWAEALDEYVPWNVTTRNTMSILAAKKPWIHLADAFYGVGDRLRIACVNASDQPELDKLYSNYAQLLHTIKANIEFLDHKAEQILDKEEL